MWRERTIHVLTHTEVNNNNTSINSYLFYSNNNNNILPFTPTYSKLSLSFRISYQNTFSHTYVCDYKRGYGLVNGVIDHLYTPVETTSNYRAIADLYTLLVTSTCLVFSVFTRRFLAKASSIRDSSASRAQVLLSQPPVRIPIQLTQLQHHLFSALLAELNWTAKSQLTTELVKSKSNLRYDRRSAGQSVLE
jgi:hypothetical protein